MKYTNGSKLTMGLGYIKFYFHGIVFFLTVKPLRLGGTTLFLERLNLTFPVDMGIEKRLTFNKGDVEYIPSAVNGLRVFPWSGQTLTNYQEDTQWSLIWRIVKTFINTSSSGKQVGDNWDNYEASKFITANGNEYLFQEIGCCDAANESKSLLNANISFELNADVGISDDCYPLQIMVKNYITAYEE